MLDWLRVAALGLAFLAAAPASANAASDATPAQVRAAADAFDRGREAYKSGDLVAAAEAFERADSQVGSPIALEYAIRSRDKAGHLERAATLAALAARRYPGEASLEKLVRDVLARGRTELHELTIDCSEPCELVVDGKLLHGKSDFERVVFLTDGEHTLRAGFPGARSDVKTVTAAAGGQGSLVFEAPPEVALEDEPEPEVDPEAAERVADPEPAPRALPPEPREADGWSPGVFWVGAGLTAALGAVTLWSGLDTVNNPGESAVREACRSDHPDCQSLYDEGRERQSRTNLLLGATGVVGLATIVIGAAAVDWGDEDAPDEARRAPRSRARVEPWLVVGRGALLGAEGSF